jgi:hypothetical protein
LADELFDAFLIFTTRLPILSCRTIGEQYGVVLANSLGWN